VEPHESAQAFEHLLTAQGLDADRLEPWPTWKLFKSFLQQEISGVYDGASFQCEHDLAPGGEVHFFVDFVRQFTTRAGGEGTETVDQPIGRLVVEFEYPPLPVPTDLPAEVWTLDFPSDHAWASVVEGLPGFQEAMARVPIATAIYYEPSEAAE
jgi:hypothetical protein